MLNSILIQGTHLSTLSQESNSYQPAVKETCFSSDTSLRSGQRRLRQETQTTSLTFSLDLSLEQEADRLLQQEVFPTEYARYDHFKKVAQMYSDAAAEAEQSGKYDRGAQLHCKEAWVYTEKLHKFSLPIYLLRQIFSSYRNQNLDAAKILSDQIICLFDREYQQLSEQLAENPEDKYIDFVCSDIARNRIGKAAVYEELEKPPLEWQELYKEAANILLEQDDCLFDPEAGLTKQAVAAMCLEKIPQELEAAKNIYRNEFISWQQQFAEYQERQWDRGNEELSLYSIVEMFMGTKAGKFLAIKTTDQKAYLKIAKLEINVLEKYIYSEKSDPKLSDEYELFSICLYAIACQSLLEYQGDSYRMEHLEKMTRLSRFLNLDQNPERSALLEEFIAKEEIIEVSNLFQHIVSSTDCSVEAKIQALSKLHL